MAYDAVSKQVSAISKSLELASSTIEKPISTFQNMAPTMSDFQDAKWNHLDPINRISSMQTWLTKLKNRGMEIETLTSGPGIVFNYKDLNECLQTFCIQILSYSEKEMRTRSHGFQTIIKHLQNLVYIKDTRVDALKHKIRIMHENITRTVNSKIYEKGNGLIFELDRGLREVRFYKDHINTFEKEMKEFVHDQFRKALDDKDYQIDMQKKYSHDMINQLVCEFKALTTQQEIEAIEKIRIAKERCINDSMG